MSGVDEGSNLFQSKAGNGKERTIEHRALFGSLMKFPKITKGKATKYTNWIFNDPNILVSVKNESPKELNNSNASFKGGSYFKVQESSDPGRKLKGSTRPRALNSIQNSPKDQIGRSEKFGASLKTAFEKPSPIQLKETPDDALLNGRIVKGHMKGFNAAKDCPQFTTETASSSNQMLPLIYWKNLRKYFIDNQTMRGSAHLVDKATQFEDLNESNESSKNPLGKSLRTRRKLSRKNRTVKEVGFDVIGKDHEAARALFKRKPKEAANEPIVTETSDNVMDLISQLSDSFKTSKIETANLKEFSTLPEVGVKESEDTSTQSSGPKKLVNSKSVMHDSSNDPEQGQRKSEKRSSPRKPKGKHSIKVAPRLESNKPTAFESTGISYRESTDQKIPLDTLTSSLIVKKHIAKPRRNKLTQTFDSVHSESFNSKKNAERALEDPPLQQSTDDRNKKPKKKKRKPRVNNMETETSLPYLRPLGSRNNLSPKETIWDDPSFQMWQHASHRTRDVIENALSPSTIQTHKEERLIEDISTPINPLESSGKLSLLAKSKGRSIVPTNSTKVNFEKRPRKIQLKANKNRSIKSKDPITQALDTKERKVTSSSTLPFDKLSKKNPSFANISKLKDPIHQDTDSSKILISNAVKPQLSDRMFSKAFRSKTSVSKATALNDPTSQDFEKIISPPPSNSMLPDKISFDKVRYQNRVTTEEDFDKLSLDATISVDTNSSLNIHLLRELVQSNSTVELFSVGETPNPSLGSSNVSLSSSLLVDRMADKSLSNNTAQEDTKGEHPSNAKLSNLRKLSKVFSKFRSSKDTSGKNSSQAKLSKEEAVRKSISKLDSPYEGFIDKLAGRENANTQNDLGKDISQIELCQEEDLAKPTVGSKKSISKLLIKASEAPTDMSSSIDLEPPAETLNQGIARADDLIIKDLMEDFGANLQIRSKNSKSEISKEFGEGEENSYALADKESLSHLWGTHDVVPKYTPFS